MQSVLKKRALGIPLACVVFFALLKISLAPVFEIEHLVRVCYSFSALILLVSNFEKVRHMNKLYLSYIVVMLIGGIFHFISGRVENSWSEAIMWCFPILMLSFYSPQNKNGMIVLMVFFLFFFEFAITYYEQISKTNFFNFNSTLFSFEQGYNINDSKFFRSYGIFGHPLTNANVVSIFTGFLLCSNFKLKIKLPLVICGMTSILCTNSRGVVLVWFFILFYSIFLRNKRWHIICLFFLCGLLVYPYLIDLLSSFGRFSQGLDDEGTLTRITAFMLFANQNWDFSHILLGGEIIRIPGSILLIENGILLTLGYWGWIIGGLKILLELLITNNILSKYTKEQKIIIFLAVWGVAITNNNSFNDFPLICLVVVSMTFDAVNAQLAWKSITLHTR